MKQKLFLRFWPNAGLAPQSYSTEVKFDDQPFHYEAKPFVEWVIFAGERLFAEPGWCYLDQLVEQLPEGFMLDKANVFLALPSEHINLTQVSTTSKQARHLQRAVGFMLEEQLADDPTELHYAIGGKRSYSSPEDQMISVPVAVLDRQMLTDILAELAEYNIIPSRALPDSLLLPEPIDNGEEQRWTIAIDSGRLVIRNHRYSGYAINFTQIDLVLDALFQETIQNAKRVDEVEKIELTLEFVYQRGAEHDNPLARAVIEKIESRLTALIDQLAVSDEAIPMTLRPRLVVSQRSTFTMIAQNYVNAISPDLNVLQGAFKQKSKRSRSAPPLMQLVAVAAIWLVLHVGVYVSEAAWYSAEAERLDQVSRALFREINPDVQRIQSVRKQLTALLNTQSSSEQLKFLPLLEKTGQPISEINGPQQQGKRRVELRRMTFSQELSALKLDLWVDGYPTLDRLKQSLEANALIVEIEGAARDEERVKVKLTIKA